MRQPKPSELNKLVSLTFDADPGVRVQAAESLAKYDDPAAIFALAELSFDKEPTVREAVQKLLENKKQAEKEVMSFAEIFSRNQEKTKDNHKDGADRKKEKILGPITKLFERHLGKEKAELVKSKMMPSIEKVYLNQTKKDKKDDNGRKAMQEFLTSYLEVVSDINHTSAGGAEVIPSEASSPPEVLPADSVNLSSVDDDLTEELEEVSTKQHELDLISSEIKSVELDEVAQIEETKEVSKLPDTFFKKAYETMMLSGGDESTMKKEMKRMLTTIEKDMKLAFKLAKKKFKETKITNITKIKNGMRNINTDLLAVKEIESIEYQKTKTKKATLTRVIVNDEDGNEGVVYLFEDRGLPISQGMKIKIQKGCARTFDFSTETALTLGKRGSIYIVL